MTHFDVLIAGGGPAGCAAAVTLARQTCRVLLLKGRESRRLWRGESLPPGAGALVDSVFGAGLLDPSRHLAAYGTRSSWGSAELAETDFLANPLGLGWLVDRDVFDSGAVALALEAGAEVVRGDCLRTFGRRADGWRAELASGRRVHARRLVDATGRSGAVLRRLGVERVGLDRQVALLATLEGWGDPYQGTTVEAVGDGWWYTTPLPSGRRVVAYLTDSDLLPRARDPGAVWAAKLAETAHISGLLPPLREPVEARLYPAETSFRSQILGDGWAAVGDAAMALDPLSSQGTTTAILMGAKLGVAMGGHLDAGSPDSLANWERDYRMILQEHGALRAHYAGLEGRWPNSAFWMRRWSSGARRPS